MHYLIICDGKCIAQFEDPVDRDLCLDYLADYYDVLKYSAEEGAPSDFE